MMLEQIQLTAGLLSAAAFLVGTQISDDDYNYCVDVVLALAFLGGGVVFIVTSLMRIWY